MTLKNYPKERYKYNIILQFSQQTRASNFLIFTIILEIIENHYFFTIYTQFLIN